MTHAEAGPACVCEEPTTTHDCFSTRALGVDATEGRFADVTVLACRHGGRRWLRYLAEYEATPRSGRWARGLIAEQEVEAMTPEAAAGYLERLPWHLYGGSYFDGATGRRPGSMSWAP